MENFKILEEKENPLFNRKEIQASIESQVTPSNSDIKKLISEKFSTQIENIKVKKILGKFGSKTFKIFANIYTSKKDKEDIEPKSKKETKERSEPESQEPEQAPKKDESITNQNNSEPSGETN